MPHRAGAFMEYRFATEDLPERDRVPAWREHFARTVLGIDFEPLPEAPLQADMRLRALPGLPIGSGFISAARHERTCELITDGNDDLYVVAVKGSPCMVSQRGQEMALGDGDAVLISASDVSTFISFRTMHFINVRIPFAALAPLVTDLNDTVTRPIARHTEALRHLTRYLDLLRRDDAPATPDLQRLAIAHVHDLAALAIGATRDAAAIAEGRGLRAARLREILAEIRSGFADPAFSPEDIARKLRITTRYLQKLLHDTDASFTERVLELRLQRARAMLAERRYDGLKVIEIAHACGFDSISYFHRRFRARFGASPMQYRGTGGAPDSG